MGAGQQMLQSYKPSATILTSTQPSTFDLQTSETSSRWARVLPDTTIYVTGVTRSTLTTATRCYIKDNSGAILATSTTLVGDMFVFSNFAVTAARHRFEMDAGWGSYNFEYCNVNTAATSLNIAWQTGSLNWADNGNPGNVKSIQYYV